MKARWTISATLFAVLVATLAAALTTADNTDWFRESNNSTWADVQLKGGKVSVLRYGPSAQPISS